MFRRVRYAHLLNMTYIMSTCSLPIDGGKTSKMCRDALAYLISLLALGYKMTSLIFDIPVTYITILSKPKPKPLWGTLPYLREVVTVLVEVHSAFRHCFY